MPHGTLAITARGDGSRWYGRISITVAAAREAGLKEGTRISAKCIGGEIVIQPDEAGRIRFPAARGKAEPKHAFEAATSTLGLREVKLCQSPTHTEVSEGQIKMRVPEECRAAEETKERKPRKEPARQQPEQTPAQLAGLPKHYGSAAAIITEAGRSGKLVRPMSLPEIIAKLIELGQNVQVQGPRFFKLNGKSVTSSDLLDEINRLSGSTEHDRIALIMD